MKKLRMAQGAVIALALLFLACGEEKQQAGAKGALPVGTKVLQAQTTALNFEYPARLKSPQSVEIYARVQGILLSKNFKEGDFVKQGDKLFKIDPTTYQNKVNSAKAQYQAAEANLTKTTRDWKRTERLYKQGVITVDTYDSSLYNYQAALANVTNTKANLDDALVDLGYTDVVASISGRTGMRQLDVGNLVGQGNNNVLTTVTQLSPIYAEFAIPSTDFYYIRDLNNANVSVEVVTGNGKVHEEIGKLDFIDSVLDSQTLSVKARAIVGNDKFKLLPNELVRVNLKGFEAKDSIAIPQSALLQDKEGSFVYLYDNGKVKKQSVILGKLLRNAEILIPSGLKSGDIIITTNLSKIRPGMDVTQLPSQPSQPSQAL
ncbi:efflux RND transporter periplasmic adaptor subunit [Helicobacter sp. MIT 00-7814]|uniref:efflux RND transporter periplasmic adaptor subunit n=1 Tax=unclassified Helicobacter TaxID=2593540 RepID=UPI000E1EBC34|nr:MULTISPECIES: efflux RND transporter periplasmic adaptor subunit [unclassified Helicobacter]RDU55865.1 efflux RND transporter periplasmic adaptor subunit [Helicobacter sp. MIT 00-7814]RDU56823.1 efflux RND transporter periplasmic adaptor subunit [Helicobacter sp. MIT 99-10781]